MAEAKVEIISKITIKPLSPTPNHLKHYRISLLDELVPPSFGYVPILLFYSTSDHDFIKLSQKLKTSLSEVLTLYYPFCGRIRKNQSNNVYVDCNDEGILYLEATIPSKLSDFLNKYNNPQSNEVKGCFPLDPYNPNPENDDEHRLIMAVQVNEFGCGGVGIGVCISHKICDGTTAASFLQAWSQKAMGNGSEVASTPLNMEASLLFPPKDIEIDISKMIREKNITMKKFLFSGNSLCRLQEEISRGSSFKPTRVEAVTALIWKSAMEAAITTDTTHQTSSFLLHAVNIRGRMLPPLPENSLGNLFLPAFSPLLEVDKEAKLELQDLAEVVGKTIRKVDSDYVSKFQGDDAQKLTEILGSMLEVMHEIIEKGVPCYLFSSWVRFGLYEINFGWGMPSWVCTIEPSARNIITLMPTKRGDGIEAWVTLNDLHMLQFENNPQLLQFVSSFVV